MPALVLFGRRWRLGSDDLAIPVAVYLLLHIPAIIMLSTYNIIMQTSNSNLTIVKHAQILNPDFIKQKLEQNANSSYIKPILGAYENSDLKEKLNRPSMFLSPENSNISCNLKNETACDDFTLNYANCINVIYIAEFILEFLIICISCKGSIIDEGPRKSIHKFIYLRVFIGFLESVPWFVSVCLLIMPCRALPYLVSDFNYHHFKFTDNLQFTERCTFLTFLICFQLAVSTVCYFHTFLLFFFSYDSTGRDSDYNHVKSAKIWDRRLRFLFCCIKLPELDLNPDESHNIHINMSPPEFDSEEEDYHEESEAFFVKCGSLNGSIRSETQTRSNPKNSKNVKFSELPEHPSMNTSSNRNSKTNTPRHRFFSESGINTPLLTKTTSTPDKIKQIRQDHGISKKAGNISKNFDIVQAVARMFSMFFKDVNLVPSDFMAALLLYRKRQKEEEYQTKFSIRHILSTKAFVDNKLQSDMLLYLQYCQAIYGEMLYIFDSVMMGPQTTKERVNDLMKFKPLANLNPLAGRNQSLTSDNHNVETGNVASTPDLSSKRIHQKLSDATLADTGILNGLLTNLNQTGLILWLEKFQLMDEKKFPGQLEIKQFSRMNGLLESPYFIAKDNKRNEYIITIRGTMSLTDALTDMMMEVSFMFTAEERQRLDRSQKFTRQNSGKKMSDSEQRFSDFKGHDGMVKSVHAMYKGMASVLEALDKDTQIVVTGHSLGAGIAGILAIYKLRSK